MNCTLILLLLSFFLLTRPLVGECAVLRAGEKVTVSHRKGLSHCFRVEVGPGEIRQVVVSQPVDVRVEARQGGRSLRADGFEFGPETLTLGEAGSWEVRVESLEEAGPARRGWVEQQRRTQGNAGRWRQAEEVTGRAKQSNRREEFEQALEAWKELGQASAVARMQLKLGDEALGRGDARQAGQDYAAGARQCAALRDARCQFEALNNSGVAAESLGQYAEARARYQEALVAGQPLGRPDWLAIVYSNLGAISREAGEYQKSIGYLTQAVRLMPAENHAGLGKCWDNLGLDFQALMELSKARGYFQKALAEHHLAKAFGDALSAQMNLGRTSLLEGKAAVAEQQLRRTAQDAAVLRKDRIRAHVLSNLGQALNAQGKWKEARQVLEEALRLHQAAGDRRFEAIDWHHLGWNAGQVGETSTAREWLKKAIAIREANGMRDGEAESQLVLAELERRAGNLEMSRRAADRALRVTETLRSGIGNLELRASYLARKRRIFDLLVQLEATPEAKFLMADRAKARSLLDGLNQPRQGSRQGGRQTLPRSAQREWEGLQREIDYLASQLGTANEARAAGMRSQVEMMVARQQALEAGETPNAMEPHALAPPLRLADLQARLRQSRSALLAYHLGEESSLLWLVSGEQLEMFPLPGRQQMELEAEAVVKLFGDLAGRRRSAQKQRDFEARLRQLGQRLLGPLEGRAVPGRVLLVADGDLARVPFAALPWRGSALGIEKDLLQLPAAAFLLTARSPKRPTAFPQTVLVLADPVFGGQDQAWPLARLPYVEEVNLLEELVPTGRRTILRGPAANRAEFARQPLGQFAYLHLSTHALVDDRVPELSRLALSVKDASGREVDGFLKAPEIAQWKLEGGTVVLSACETALGKQVRGEGLLGLTTSLILAGAAQAVVSIAPVEAEATSWLFREFYREALGPGQAGNETSLRKARQSLRQSKRWGDPYYWASFIVIGAPSPRR